MLEVRKKYFGDPIHKKPVSFGKHYMRAKKENVKDKLNVDQVDIEKLELVGIAQNHPHSFRGGAINNDIIVNVLLIMGLLVFCLALLYVGVTQLDRNIVFAVVVPTSGFFMVCWLVYLTKVDFYRKQSNIPYSSYKSQRKFRKGYKQRNRSTVDSHREEL